MKRNRIEEIAGVAVVVILGAVIVYGLRSGENVGALPLLLGVAIREVRKSRRAAAS